MIKDRRDVGSPPSRLVKIQSVRNAVIFTYLVNSDCQLARVDTGATIRNGPRLFLVHKWARKAIVWMVFPKPISSASMPFKPDR
jgi:hypothetical protein